MKRILALFLALILLLFGCAVPQMQASDLLEVRFLDVGQADAALLRCGGDVMLIDGGNRADASLIASVLKREKIDTLNYVVCSHAHEDHVGGLPAAFKVCAVETVLTPVDAYSSEIFNTFLSAAKGSHLTIPSPGDVFPLGDATVTVLGPTCEYEEPNDTSLVLKIQHGNVSFLFTGDMERAAEEDLLEVYAESDLESTVLKVGHHGSNTSSSYPFLRAVNPQYAVISVGEDNDYGHPHDEVLSRMRDAEVPLYRTDLQGDIIARSDGTSVTFETARGKDAVTNPTADEAIYYIGNKKSQVFHRPGCKSLPKENNRVAFATREKALASGFTPCGNCHA